jgi:serine/threonine protein kinase
MLAALSALHANGIIHRDLKPTNVFLTRQGVKLLDFGLARPSVPERSDSPLSSSELTRTGTMVGTPGYMAPEQVTAGAVDARSDLFAAGAILFEMLAGRPAFSGNTFVEILHATLHAEPPALTGSAAVAAADRAIRRALSKRPADRPVSAEAMAAELAALRGSSPVRRGRARTGTRVSSPRGRQRVLRRSDARRPPAVRRAPGDPRFQAILADAEAGRRRALAAFREAGGERLLGR